MMSVVARAQSVAGGASHVDELETRRHQLHLLSIVIAIVSPITFRLASIRKNVLLSQMARANSNLHMLVASPKDPV
jgi:hypothetical protein